MNQAYSLGIDLGGTNIKAALINAKGKVLEEVSKPTHDKKGQDNSAEWKATIKDMVQYFYGKPGHTIEAIGISSPGTANPENSGITSNPNKLIGIENFIWKDYLEKETVVLNDAHAALFAESRIGIGKGFKDILMLTLGTGVGGGIMINGKLLQGQKGRAGHVGHISISQEPTMSIVNAPGSLESAIGEHTISQRTYGKYESTKNLVEAYLKGEAFASWAWLNSVQSLARGLISLINTLSPELIILSGGITQAGEALLQPLKAFMEVYEWQPAGFQTPVKLAQLSTLAGAVGAGLFALEMKSQKGTNS